ncbi:CBM_collapsed_G0056940.mRNA.1.CDS.1 [Saccharomyces cerevisiae]|nr:CBM_collapsed_G0056940.mRNA.1.CDS.1 [Saccharomyces cerevisiae]
MMPYNTPPNIQEPMNFASSNPFGIIPDALSFQNFKYDRLQQQQQQQHRNSSNKIVLCHRYSSRNSNNQ